MKKQDLLPCPKCSYTAGRCVRSNLKKDITGRLAPKLSQDVPPEFPIDYQQGANND